MMKTEILIMCHALYNAILFLCFIYQSMLGLRIRERRKSGSAPVARNNRLHRKFGPVLVFAGIAGCISGFFLVYYDYKSIFNYKLHSVSGFSIAVLLPATYYISKKIKAGDSPWRLNHFRLGFFILCLYCIQVLLGIIIIL